MPYNVCFRVSRLYCGRARMIFGNSHIPRAALALVYTLLLAGCAAERLDFGSGYSTVPVQIVVLAGARYEILDRADVGRVTITALSEPETHWGAFTARVREYISLDPISPNYANGSLFYEPLMQYFAQSNRTCRLIRGNPLAHPRWEFVYTCRPGYDGSTITWQSSGYSNAPSYPNW